MIILKKKDEYFTNLDIYDIIDLSSMNEEESMKKFVGKQKYCFITMFSLIVICEVLLRIDNKFIQIVGISLVPFIILFGFLLIKNDKRNINIK